VVAIFIDITERKKAQQIIEEARAYAENIVETMREPLIVLNTDLKIISANRAFYQTFKVGHKETESQFIYDLGNRQWDIPKLRTLLEEILPKNNIFDDYEIEHNFETIGPKIMLFNARRLATMQMILITIEDITERKKAEEKIKEAANTKAAFTSKVSHELRTPLTAMKEGIALVLDGLAGDINEEQKELLGIAKKNVDRLTRLINDVLDFQKLDSGKMKFNLEANDVNQIVNDVYKIMVLPSKNGEPDFLLELDENLPKARFDSDKITQVLTNLVNNAMKFTEKGNITIKTSKTEDAVQVSVYDTGCGIRKEDLPKLFDSFAQLGNGGQRKTGGTGLGLIISKEIVEQHGGRIWVESEPGRGSKFMFTIPICCSEGLLKKYINDGIRQASKNDTKMSLILISIADFDKLEQKLPHEKITSTLKDIEAILDNDLSRGRSKPNQVTDTVFRFSNEIFIVLAKCGKENIPVVKERLEQKLDEYLADKNLADKIKLFFGCVTYPDDAVTSEELIKKARELHPIVSTALSA
jgi:two-component system CheB/CheR fusion protein